MSEDHHDDHHEEHDHCGTEDHTVSVSGRRQFLRRSLGSLIGLSIASPMLGLVTGTPQLSGLSSLWAADPLVEQMANSAGIRSIVLLWMDGGPAQTDTFDPKPGSKNGGAFKAINTALPGVQFSEHLPRVASIADRLAVIRSMTTGEGNHQRAKHYMRTGYKPAGTVKFPGMGAMAAHEMPKSPLEIPMNVSINAPGNPAGFLGVRYDPFYIPDPSKPVQNLALPAGITQERFSRRLLLLGKNESRFSGALGAAGSDVESYQKIADSAHAFMKAPEASAFDISQEPKAVIEAYGDTKFGRGCLMARRLVEKGVKFVEVALNGWDTHQDNFTKVANNLSAVDPAMHALITDLEARDLLDSTLIIWMGEFGRTPKINGNDGRDHFPGAWSVVMAGGGIQPGVIGATSADGTKVISPPTKTEDLFRSIYRQAGLDPDKQFDTPAGRPIKIANGGSLIPGLVTV
jgi:hypothetical protein